MIEEEIQKAATFYRAYGSTLREDPGVQELLGKYRNAIACTYRAMAEEGILEACARCAQSPSGSCCFEGVEDGYDSVQLLINLLLEVRLPSRREIPKACFFLGPGGCALQGRDAFCVNFLCPTLKGERRDGRLQRITGQELYCGWELEKNIRRRINGWTAQAVPGKPGIHP